MPSMAVVDVKDEIADLKISPQRSSMPVVFQVPYMQIVASRDL